MTHCTSDKLFAIHQFEDLFILTFRFIRHLSKTGIRLKNVKIKPFIAAKVMFVSTNFA